MATVIRVKRRVDEEPLDAFVLNCKKRKYDDANDDAAAPEGAQDDDTSATVVKFAGTVDSQVNIAFFFCFNQKFWLIGWVYTIILTVLFTSPTYSSGRFVFFL